MIDTEQTALIDVGIDKVWTYVKDMERWASIMPGYRECEIIDENDSVWTLKVGVGALIRTVKVRVHVDQWDGPEQVHFSYRLQGDPVEGGGTYNARAIGSDRTEIRLHVRVEGGGPMAAMWEAMGKPLLPKFAGSFAQELKARVELFYNAAAPRQSSSGRTIGSWLRDLWAWLTGRRRMGGTYERSE